MISNILVVLCMNALHFITHIHVFIYLNINNNFANSILIRKLNLSNYEF